MTDKSLPDDAVIAARKEHFSTTLEGETVLLTGHSDQYYGLDRVGTAVWEYVQEPRTLDEICARILASFDVDPERCQTDVRRLVLELETEGFVDVQRRAVS